MSTAMPLCHWPCSCYPNHSLNQVNDWMNEIYERWVAAHAVVIVTPTHWYQTSSALKLMIDRLVCADGGNPDPTSTHGKDPPRPRRSSSRAGTIRSISPAASTAWWCMATSPASRARGAPLSDWLDWMGLIDAGDEARLDRYVGYYEPYATSHDALDRDDGVQEESRNVARAVARVTRALRSGELQAETDTTCPGRDQSDFAALQQKSGNPGARPDDRGPVNPILQKILAATGLTRRGELVEATETIQRALSRATARRLPASASGSAHFTRDRRGRRARWAGARDRRHPADEVQPAAGAPAAATPSVEADDLLVDVPPVADRPRTGALQREHLHRRSRHAQLQAVRAGRLRGSRLAPGRHAARLHPESRTTSPPARA